MSEQMQTNSTTTISSSSPKFYCHQCQEEIQPISLDDLKCSICGSEFIEELEMEEESTTTSQPQQSQQFFYGSQQSPQFVFPQQQQQQQQGLPFLNIFNQMFQAVQQQNLQQNQPHQAHVNINFQSFPLFSNFAPQQAQGESAQQGDPFAVMLQQLFTGMGIPVVGNPGDYVGDASFDNIITQLFESANDRGPPPASQDVVETLPTEIVDQESVDNKEDCPVCKEEYTIGDEVMKLECSHRFHPECLKRWLNIRNTCPVCRFQLKPGERTNKFNRNNNNNNGGNGGNRHNQDTNSADSPTHFYT